MTPATVAAILSALTFLATLAGIAYTSGKLTQRIDNNDKRSDAHDAKLVLHDERLGEHDVQLGKLEEWKNGYNAAARVSGHRDIGV